MLSLEDFDLILVGDQVQTAPLMPGMTKEPVTLRAAERTSTKIEFVVTYLGVTLGRWKAHKDGDGIKWQL